jgi:hypothetical protein
LQILHIRHDDVKSTRISAGKQPHSTLPFQLVRANPGDLRKLPVTRLPCYLTVVWSTRTPMPIVLETEIFLR